MESSTRDLHRAIDDAIRLHRKAYLHPEGESVPLDLLGSRNAIAWQESKAERTLTASGCWSELPQTYARYGTEPGRALLEEVRGLENAPAAVLADCGMQACALVLDLLLERGDHALMVQGAYNKTRAYLYRLADRVGAEVSFYPEGDLEALRAAIRENTRLVWSETFTNPLLGAVDPGRLGAIVEAARSGGSRRLRLVVDHTVATPWGLAGPLLDQPGIDYVVTSGTKALAGDDRDMWGYVASRRLDEMNELMDLQAMRGGILDWRRSKEIAAGLPLARERFVRRCRGAEEAAVFLSRHPGVSEVFHPSLPEHRDAAIVREHYQLPGSLLSFRLSGADEEETRHFCDVLAMTGVVRYGLSFDGLVTRVNHHRSVSEYFTAPDEVRRMGVDRLVRLAIGLEAPRDVLRCLEWALASHRGITAGEVERWQEERARDLALDACR